MGTHSAGRRLPAGAVPQLLVFRQPAVRGGRAGPPRLPRPGNERRDRPRRGLEIALAAALAGSVVARGAGIRHALDEDRNWGTTTMRPRLLTWLHSFAVAALHRWYRQGSDVQSKLPHLATYLGHVSPVSTHYYLHLSPDLQQDANQRFHQYASPLFSPGGVP